MAENCEAVMVVCVEKMLWLNLHKLITLDKMIQAIPFLPGVFISYFLFFTLYCF